MSSLLLRLAAPLQAWGLNNKFERRGTMREPTKSGVIGMIAAALGRSRDDSINDIACLPFGVRIDQPGRLLRDYHTAKSDFGKDTIVTERYYLADAIFLAGLEGEASVLHNIDMALCSPFYPLFLGRRSCPPVGKMSLGLRDTSLKDALCNEPWQASQWFVDRVPKKFFLTIMMDTEQKSILRRRDYPISYSQKHRKYTFRYIDDFSIDVSEIQKKDYTWVETDHDPFSELGG